MVDTEFIRKRHLVDGWSVRKISRQTQVSRQAVRKALTSAAPPRYRLERPRRCPVMDPFRVVIQSWLDADASAPPKQRHTAKRMYDRLVAEHGFAGAEVTARRFVRELRGSTPEVFVPLAVGWGQQMQVDWGQATVIIGGQAVEVHLFCARLRASGVPFVWAAPTERLEAFLEGHRRAFEWFDGVPAECVYDNPKTAVVKILAGPARDEHTVFASLRAHYLFDSLFCGPGEAHEKGAVENLVGYARRNALVPVPEVASWDALNAHLRGWCARERLRLADRWTEEQAHLRPLPTQPFACALTRLVAVSRMSLVQADRVRYSVPCRYVGRSLHLALATRQVEVFDGAERVAVHDRCYVRGEMVLALAHYLPALARKPRAALHAAVVEQLPPIYATVRDRLCRGQLDGYRAFVAILLLHREFAADDVTAALEEAITRDCVDAIAVRQLLLNRTAPARPQPVAVPLVLAHAIVPMPDLSRYDGLLAVAAR